MQIERALRSLGLAASAVTLQFVVATVARAQRTQVDSLVAALRSPGGGGRFDALWTINERYADSMPRPLADAVVALLDKEAAALSSHPDATTDHAYLVRLVVAGLHTRDPRATPSLTFVRERVLPVGSLIEALRSPDFNDRDGALREIIDAYPKPMPGALVDGILALLDREAAEEASHQGDEGYGEYLMDVVLAGEHTGDTRATRSLVKLGGLQVSGGVEGFVAGQGATVFAMLDSLYRSGSQGAYDAVKEYGLILGRHGELLSRADSARILAVILGAASEASPVPRDGVALVAGKIPLPEYLPVVRALAAGEPRLLEAPDAVRSLTPLLATAPPLTVLARLHLTLVGICAGATGLRSDACQSVKGQLATAIRYLRSGAPRPAREALLAVAARCDAALDQTAMNAMEHHLFSDNARLIAGRLGS